MAKGSEYAAQKVAGQPAWVGSHLSLTRPETGSGYIRASQPEQAAFLKPICRGTASQCPYMFLTRVRYLPYR